MILSQKKIEEIAVAVTKDFNEFFFGSETKDIRRMARGTPIDQFAKEYLGLEVSFAHLSPDGSICGLTAYADTEYITEEMGVKRTIPLRKNQILMDTSFIQPGQVQKLCGKRRFTLAHECAHQILFQMESETAQSAYAKKYSARTVYSLRDLKTREDWNEWQAMRNGRTVIAQDEAMVIREIFSAYINGASLQSIAELLTERKIPYSERTDVWDKARIARIIGNAKYLGDGEYDPIIEEEQYEEAAAVRTARQRNTFEKNLEGIDLLRNRVRCAECGAPMRRRVSNRHRIRESWECTNADCGQRIRISDTHLLEKVTILMNRIIANSHLLIPRPKKRRELSAEAQQINREIDAELERDNPSDALVIAKTIEMAEQLYAESDTHLQIAASIARKRVRMMTPQEEFSPAYFSDIVAYLTLGSGGQVILHTKTDVEIGGDENECNQDTEKDHIGH